MPRVQRSELQEFLCRTEAAQRLQGRGRLHRCRLGARSSRASLSSLGSSELGRACHWAFSSPGFPISLVIAWAFEATPEGIKRTAVADAASERSLGKAWIYVVIVGALLSIGLFFLGRYTAGNATPRHDASSARTEAATTPQKSIAVLPLVNESGIQPMNIFPTDCRKN